MQEQKYSLKIYSLVIMLLAALTASAIPAKRQWRQMQLADGTAVEAMMVGDEHGHWLIDRDGRPMACHDDGIAYYLSDDEITARKTARQTRLNKSNSRRIARMTEARSKASAVSLAKSRKSFSQPEIISGQKKGLVILVNFNDRTFNAKYTRDVFDRRYNEVGYSELNCIGSVHDYFYDQSYGKFDLSFDVVGPVTVSKNYSYYGKNDSDDNDLFPATLVIEALKLADENVNFADYDWDGDGEVDQVFLLYAGTGESNSNVANEIWPHEWNLSEAKLYGDGTGALTLDGVKIDTYAMSCELCSSKPVTIDGIGTACHEFAHCLGYPDFYDIDYSGGQGMMYWDIMDSGSYNGPNDNGEIPSAFTSFERWWAGWIQLTELTEPCYITDMPAINDSPVAYAIYNDANRNEYYLLENRQAKRWDSYTACNNDGTGHGMLILHVDFDSSVWENNGPNDEVSHQRMTYFPADNSYGTKSTDGYVATFTQLKGDPFPGLSKKTSFTNTTAPAATLYNKNTDGTKYMNKPITDIAENDGLISFTFMGGLPRPIIEEAVVADSNGSVKVSWEAVTGAEAYTLMAVSKPVLDVKSAKLLTEDFTGFKASGDGSADISLDLNSYMSTTGWMGQRVYNSTGRAKIGSSKSTGYLITPAVTPTTGKLTVCLSSQVYNTDSPTMMMYLVSPNSRTQLTTSEGKFYLHPTTMSSEFTCDVFTFEYPEACSVMFMPEKRAYINKVAIYDGEFTAEEIDNESSVTQTVAADTIIVEGLKETSYLLTGMKDGIYDIVVKAQYGDTESDWSEKITVSIATSSGISTISATPASNNRIYNLNGQLIGKDAAALLPGIYIINGRKTVIKR